MRFEIERFDEILRGGKYVVVVVLGCTNVILTKPFFNSYFGPSFTSIGEHGRSSVRFTGILQYSHNLALLWTETDTSRAVVGGC